jgi:outer membrane protein assembly factor BamB
MSRHRARIAALVGMVMLLAAGCWPQVGAGPDRRSYNALERDLTVANVASLQDRWTVALPGGASAPVVTGEGLVVANDLNVFALDRTTGDSRWTRTIEPTYPPEFRDLGDPIVRQDTDEVLIGASLYLGGGGHDVRLYGFDAQSGTPTSRASVDGLDTLRGTKVSGTVTDLYNAEETHRAAVRDLDTGARWGGFVEDGGTTTLDTGRLYVAGLNAVRAYDITTPCGLPPGSYFCRPSWTASLDGTPRPVVIGEDRSTLFVATAAGSVYALDAATGMIRWRAPVGSSISAAPALAGGRLYVPTDAGGVVVVSASGCGSATCTPLWRGTGEGAVTAQPVVGGGVVYVGSTNRVTAFDAAGCGSAVCAPLRTVQAALGKVRGMALSFGSLYVSGEIGVTRFAP